MLRWKNTTTISVTKEMLLVQSVGNDETLSACSFNHSIWIFVRTHNLPIYSMLATVIKNSFGFQREVIKLFSSIFPHNGQPLLRGQYHPVQYEMTLAYPRSARDHSVVRSLMMARLEAIVQLIPAVADVQIGKVDSIKC